MHVSLDGFVAGPNGEMDWIKVDNEMFEYAGERTRQADTALYGRKTWEMMEAYWPTAADKPNPSKHDIEHSEWYNRVPKIVLSRTLAHDLPNTIVLSDNIAENVQTLKKQPGQEIVIFGSPSAVHELMKDDLIDDYWLLINPIVLQDGIPLFKQMKRTDLKLVHSKTFASGVVCLHYSRAASRGKEN
jgi:dihydrofolate reductase